MADRYSVISYHSSVELQYLFIVVFMLHGKKRKMGTFDFGENFIASLKVWVLGSCRNMYPRFPWGLVNTHPQTLPTSSKRYDQICIVEKLGVLKDHSFSPISIEISDLPKHFP